MQIRCNGARPRSPAIIRKTPKFREILSFLSKNYMCPPPLCKAQLRKLLHAVICLEYLVIWASNTVNSSMSSLWKDLSVLVDRQDDRRLEVIANGLPLWGGVQLAVDTTLVSPLDSLGRPRSHARRFRGAALRYARLAKERTYPELLRAPRCRLVVVQGSPQESKAGKASLDARAASRLAAASCTRGGGCAKAHRRDDLRAGGR